MEITKILLVCPKYNFEGYTPTGLASIATIAENLGHQVKIVDLNLEKLPKEHYDLVGITGLSLWRKQIIETSKMFPDTPVIVGGAWASSPLSSRQALSVPSIDYVCMGEGEITFHKFLKNYPNVEHIQGIGYKNGNNLVLNPWRPFIHNLNSLPTPAWHLLDLHKYERVSIITSRGCPYPCVFCSDHTLLGRKWRARNVESVVDEIETLVKYYHVKHITFGDENMTLIPERFKRICEEIIKRGIKAEFDAIQGVRADKLPMRLLELMKEAGFVEIIIAPESGSQRVLDEIIHKDLDLSVVTPVVKKCEQIGLTCGAFFVIGFPHETMEEINTTISFAEKLQSHGCSTYIGNAMPYRDTELYQKAKQEGFLRFDGEELDSILFDLVKPRKIHCLSSPYWTPQEIIRICSREKKKNLRNFYQRYSLTTKISKFIHHPISSVQKMLKAWG